MPTSKRPRAPRALTFAEQLRKIDERSARKTAREQRKAARVERRAAKAAAPVKFGPSQRPQMPDLSTLTVADRQRCCDALGLAMPTPEGSWGPQPDERLSAQLRDRFVTDLGRYETHQRGERDAAMAAAVAGFDATTAPVADVNAALQRMGIRFAVELHEPGKPLQPPPQRDLQHAAHVQEQKDREVALVLQRALELGKAFDARRVTPGQLRQLLLLRGVGL